MHIPGIGPKWGQELQNCSQYQVLLRIREISISLTRKPAYMIAKGYSILKFSLGPISIHNLFFIQPRVFSLTRHYEEFVGGHW